MMLKIKWYRPVGWSLKSRSDIFTLQFGKWFCRTKYKTDEFHAAVGLTDEIILLHSTEQSPSSEANRSLASQEIPRIL